MRDTRMTHYADRTVQITDGVLRAERGPSALALHAPLRLARRRVCLYWGADGAEVAMRARDAVRKEPVSVSPDMSIGDVAVLMNERVVGAVVVLASGSIAGIVTDRDLVVRGLAAGVPPDARVDAVMTADVVTLDANADLREALPIFRSHGFRRLPLVDGTELVGMLTVDDLLIDLVSDLGDVVRPITGEVVFGFAERPMTPDEKR